MGPFGLKGQPQPLIHRDGGFGGDRWIARRCSSTWVSVRCGRKSARGGAAHSIKPTAKVMHCHRCGSRCRQVHEATAPASACDWRWTCDSSITNSILASPTTNNRSEHPNPARAGLTFAKETVTYKTFPDYLPHSARHLPELQRLDGPVISTEQPVFRSSDARYCIHGNLWAAAEAWT